MIWEARNIAVFNHSVGHRGFIFWFAEVVPPPPPRGLPAGATLVLMTCD